jgi:hypothetical protein
MPYNSEDTLDISVEGWFAVSKTHRATNQYQILGAFISVITPLSIALYFTGWIYRWAYFGFFRIQLTTLDLPAQSFFFIPFQVFFGSPQAFIKALLIIGLAIICILLSLNFLNWRRVVRRLFLPLLKDFVIVAWILTALFWIARWQGEVDAWQAAVNNTSLLPVVTVVQTDKGLGLGYSPKDSTYSPLEKARIIGDVGLFVNKLRGQEVKIPGTPSQVGDWRLLINNKGWLYLFQALSPNVDDKRGPLVLAIREGGGDQLVILSPTAFEEKSP